MDNENGGAPVELKRIRTFQSDVEELIKNKQVSKSAIALAESQKKIQEDEKAKQEEIKNKSAPKMVKILRPALNPYKLKKVILTVWGLIIVVGLFLGGYLFWPIITAPKEETKVAPPVEVGKKDSTINSIEAVNDRKALITALNSSFEDAIVPQNDYKIIPVLIGGRPLTSSDFLEILESEAPQELVRALGDPSFGKYGIDGGEPFIIFPVKSYDYAFAGMLSWEKTLVDDIAPIFGVEPRKILTNVGSTTEDVLKNALTIKDVIIRNEDVRAVYEPGGSVIFLYSFVDKQTLIFTASEDVLKALINKASGAPLLKSLNRER